MKLYPSFALFETLQHCKPHAKASEEAAAREKDVVSQEARKNKMWTLCKIFNCVSLPSMTKVMKLSL